MASRKAFTLIEIVIAISIMSIVFMVAYRALTQITLSKSLLDDERVVLQLANTLMSKLSRELQMAVATNKIPDPNYEDYYLIGIDKTLSNGESGDRLIFVANEAGQYVPDGQRHAGLVMLSYRVEEDPESKGSDQKTYLFIRDEIPLIRPFKNALKNRMTFPVSTRLQSLDFSYYHGRSKTWQKRLERPGQLARPSRH